MTSARGDTSPPIFHPGWKLLSPAYWQELLSIFLFAQPHAIDVPVGDHRMV